MRSSFVSLLFALLLTLFFAETGLADHLSTLPASSTAQLVIKSASEYDYPPYCIVSPDNQADGFSVELLRATLKAMALDVSFNLGPWSEVKQSLVDGQVQVLPLVGRTPEREKDFDFTFPYLTMHGTLVVRDSETEILSLNDLKNKQVAVMAGDNAEEFLHRIDLGATIVATPSFDEALTQLSGGEHDAVVMQKLVALQLMNNLNLRNLKTVGPPLEAFVQSFCFAVRKGDTQLLSTLNEGLSIVIADGTFHHLREKWFGPIESLAMKKSRIIVGGDADYPPYEFLDANGQATGYNVELTRAVARQLGLNVEVQLRPWSQIRKGLANNSIDAVHGMFYSPERDQSFDFSPPHTLISHVIVARKGSALPKNMAELQGKSILVMDGDIMHDFAVEQGYEQQLVLVKSQEEALEKLAEGNYDCALVARIPALYWIEKHGWNNLQINENPVLSPEYCFAVPHGNVALLARFSESLATLKATGEYRQIYTRWFGVYEEPEFSPKELLKYALYAIAPFLLVILAGILWNRSLKSKVTEATILLHQEIAERKLTHEELHAKNGEMERFLYMVSHDLKSPVVTIKGFVGMLRDDLRSGDEEAIVTDLDYIDQASSRLGTLLDDLLEISRVGKVAGEGRACSFNELTQSAQAMLAGTILDKQVEVTQTDAEIPLYGDYNRLQEIWQNLLENAIKYMGEQKSPRVHLGVEQTEGEVTFFVRDNGMGIEPQYQKQIFDLFEKLDQESEGTGLGLAILARIVELNKGRIWVESEGRGKGSCFFFTLPAAIRTDLA